MSDFMEKASSSEILSSRKASESNEFTFAYSNDRRVSIDEPIHTDNCFADAPGQAVKINNLQLSIPPSTIPSFFAEAVDKYAHRSALVYEDSAVPTVITYRGFYTAVLNAASSLIAMGLEPKEVVAVSCFNSPHQFIMTLGTIFAGGIYTDLNNYSKHSVLYNLLEDSQASFIVVDSDKKISQILHLWNELPRLKAIIFTANEMEKELPNVFTWSSFLAYSNMYPVKNLAARLDNLAPNICCAIFYNSNKVLESSKPKGIMMSHDNLAFMAYSLKEEIWPNKEFEPHRKEKLMSMTRRTFSFLSPSSAIGMVIDILLPITTGSTVFFADENIWQGKMIETLTLVKPTIFFATARFWILLQRSMKEKFRHLSFLEKYWLVKARKLSLRSYRRSQITKHISGYRDTKNKLARNIQSRLKRKLGFNYCSMFFSIEGLVPYEVQEFFISIGIPICEAVGSSLLSGPHCLKTLTDFQLGCLGKEMPGCLTTFEAMAEKDKSYKLLVTGRHVCMGTLHDPQRLSLTANNFLDSGITVHQFESAKFKVITPNQDMLYVNNGCYVQYEAVEQLMMCVMPVISNCMLIGSNKPFFSIIIAVKTQIDPDTKQPLNLLTTATSDWLYKFGIRAITTYDLKVSKPWDKLINRALQSVNRQMGSMGNWIKKWTMLEFGFSVLDGEIDPVINRLNRTLIMEKYRRKIESMYQHDKKKMRV